MDGFRQWPHYALYTNALAADKAGLLISRTTSFTTTDCARRSSSFVKKRRTGPQWRTKLRLSRVIISQQFGRTDLNSQAISSKEFDARSAAGPVYVIVQRGRTYFENREELDYVRENFRRVHEVTIDGASAVEVFLNH